MNRKSRTEYAAKNYIYSTIGTISNSLLSFVSRTVFIYYLGTMYLGVNGLFSNILGMLSLAELGLGSAVSFSLYKPLADNDIKKIIAIIHFYKFAYRIIALIISVIGLCLIPFLDVIAKGADGLDNLVLIYCIFLFNSVSSYLFTYKTTLLSADQRNYLITNINTVVKIITNVFQMVSVIIFRNFMVYLLVGAAIQLLGKIYMNLFTDKQFPYIKGKHSERLTKQEKRNLFSKIKALLMHKIGTVAIYQSDSIITSSFINVNTVGLVANFTLIISTVNMFVSSFFQSAIAGLGNVIATETLEQKKEIFDRYNFLGFCFYGFTTVCLVFLIKPFIRLWIGEEYLIDDITIVLLCLNYFLTGMRTPIVNMQGASGLFEPDRWAPLLEAAVNIVISIVGAIHLGLKGIYIGTIVSSLIPSVVKPFYIYKYAFKESAKCYFVEYAERIIVVILICGVIALIFKNMSFQNAVLEMIFKLFVSVIIFIATVTGLYHKTKSFKYMCYTAKSYWEKITIKLRG